MAIYVIPEWIKALDNDDLQFIKRFILSSGSLKDMSKQYNISYPTIRKRLDKLIDKIRLIRDDDEPYITLIKNLALDSKIDYDTAKILIDAYRSEKERE